jgi:anthranilate phosphoribosyltransferase
VTAHGWPDVLSSLVARQDLSGDQTAWAMREILGGEASPAQIAGFAVALRSKGETVAEVEGLVRTMYEHAIVIDVPGRTIDLVGTGGDRAHTVNITTMAAIVVAGAGLPVVKHGNRAASSHCGTADVLEALGVPLDLTPERVGQVGQEAGITFCFAPVFHPALRHAAVPRRELGVATTFNFLGPLANPARPPVQAVGCADLRMAPVLAGVLARRGTDALVFRGDDGLDELTTTTTSQVWLVSRGEVEPRVLDPDDYGIARGTLDDLRGGDAALNAAVVGRVLSGERGPIRDAVLLNAGAALAIYPDSPGSVNAGSEGSLGASSVGSFDDRVSDGIERAARSLDSGAASLALKRWIEVSSTP